MMRYEMTERNDAIRAAVEQGESKTSISKRFGVSKSRISQLFPERRLRKWDAFEVAMLCDLKNSGYTTLAIARVMGITPTRINWKWWEIRNSFDKVQKIPLDDLSFDPIVPLGFVSIFDGFAIDDRRAFSVTSPTAFADVEGRRLIEIEFHHGRSCARECLAAPIDAKGVSIAAIDRLFPSEDGE